MWFVDIFLGGSLQLQQNAGHNKLQVLRPVFCGQETNFLPTTQEHYPPDGFYVLYILQEKTVKRTSGALN